MQVSTKQFYRAQLENLSRLQQQSGEIQAQISSGKRLLAPSDDPTSYSRVTSLEGRRTELEQFTRNMNAAALRLSLEENTLSQATAIATRMKELAIQGASDALGTADRTAIATELQELVGQMAGIANAIDGNGEYVFGGFKSNEPPFVIDANGNVDYVGDDGRREVEIADGITIATASSGAETFMRIPRPGNVPASIFDIAAVAIVKLREGWSTRDEIGSIHAAVDHFTTYQTISGSRLGKLEAQRSSNDAAALQTEATLSALQDTDLAKAVTELKQKLNAQEAAQASFVKITEATLFNYLR
jgi:flagellar hook-associated protein 3 FlgL